MTYIPPDGNDIQITMPGVYLPRDGEDLVLQFNNYLPAGYIVRILTQPYALVPVHIVGLSQRYALADLKFTSLEQNYILIGDPFFAELTQYYHLQFYVRLTQYYGDVGYVLGMLRQYYWDAAFILKRLRQEWGDAEQLYAVLDQYYDGPELLVAQLIQLYTIVNQSINNPLAQEYALSEFDTVIKQLRQSYSLAPDSSLRKPVSSVQINGVDILTLAISLEYSLDQYVGSCSLTLATYEQWNAVQELDPVVVTVNAQEYHFIVTDLKKTDTHKGSTFYVEGLSQAVLLDFPYASEVTDDSIVHGFSSEICSRLAALEDQTITWEIPVDPQQTVSSFQVSGESPLSAIRSLVNELGGKLQSYPNGDFKAVPSSVIDSDKYDAAEIDYSFSSAFSFTSLSTDHDKRNGYNKFLISNETAGGQSGLESEKVSPGHFKIKYPKVPWDSTPMSLRTSELTNVTIVPAGETVEIIEDELVEIVEGEGQTEHSVYELTDIDYSSRVNLGDITFSEAGVITTTTQAETLLTLSYQTKYWLWDVYGTDSEDVQFIVE